MIDLSVIDRIKDEETREGVRAAVYKTLLPAHTDKAYPGHFTVVADGSAFGAEYTWPGLDSWEMAGAYLELGMEEAVTGYFDFVQASQRADGNIPFAIWTAEDFSDPESRKTFARGLNYPDDIYAYKPPCGTYPAKNWIGLFNHWAYENPLSILAPVCYPMTAGEIFSHTKDTGWLKVKLPSLEKACSYILTKKSSKGLIGGAGFYIELPPRREWDGITQCYTYKAFSDMALLYEAAGNREKAVYWKKQAEELKAVFRLNYWKDGHFAEYIHPEYGAVDFHGFCDVDWAAIGLGLADDSQIQELWPGLLAEKNFWWGGMPTQAVTKPYTYREWEFGKKVPFETNGPIYDMAAMGRIWYVEMTACLAMKDYDRVRQAVALVCRMGLKHDGYWFERYHMLQDRRVSSAGPKGYCEYAAILTRIVLGNMELFT
jgi:hypothetical protein